MAAMLMGAWSLQSCDNGPTKEVWLDEFGQDSCYVQDWGMLEVNRSVVHTPLTVNGVVYERGLGAHSISRLLYCRYSSWSGDSMVRFGHLRMAFATGSPV